MVTTTRINRTAAPKAKYLKPSEDVLTYTTVTQSLKRILACAQEELEFIREMKAEAIQYRQDALKKDDSEGRQLILNARLIKHREIEEVVRQAGEEIQKILADIRITRISLQDELIRESEIAEANRLNVIFDSIKEAFQKPEGKNLAKNLQPLR
ncbi:MAG: hypothetical protein PHG35_00300 [Dehalococcoidales bacterium]|nr:hypothetical protein [Dehalococcoidales bacterium]